MKAVEILILIVVVDLVGFFLTHSGDPYTYCLNCALLAIVAATCYWIGFRHGRDSTANHDRKRMPDTGRDESRP